jgi:glycosyltransferase involved in cell wall biosynthesis
VHNLANALTDLEHEVTVIAPRYSRSLRHLVRYRLLPTPPGMLTLFAQSEPAADVYFGLLATRLSRERFDVVNVHFALPLGLAFIRHRHVLRVPIVVTFHGTDIQVMPSIGYGLRVVPGHARRIKSVILQADGLVAVSEAVHQSICEMCAGPLRIFRIPHGVDAKRLRAPGVPGAFRRRMGLPGGARVILAVGRNHPKKGFSFLIQAMGIVRSAIPEARCVIVGKNSDRLAADVRAAGVEDCVLLSGEIAGGERSGELGFPAQPLLDAYQGSDVFVCASLIESFSMVVLEAQAAGLPVVATDAPGHRDLIVDGHNGLLCRAADPDDLAQKIVRALRDDQLRRRLGAAAAVAAAERDWEKVGVRYVEAFTRVIASAQQAPAHVGGRG